jgi:alpha-ketoglutarate-dependent taurine dioxygenase
MPKPMSALELEPVAATFGATVRNVELRALDDRAFRAIHDAWIEHALLIFPRQFLTREEQNTFARRFGELEFEADAITNLDDNGVVHSALDDDRVRTLKGNQEWHHDSTYMPIMAKGAVFTAEIIPSEGGATGWADMRAAYEALDNNTRNLIQELSAYHSLVYSQGRAGLLPSGTSADGYKPYGHHDGEPSLRPLVKVHPNTGLPNLLIGRHAYGIVGMEPDESERLLDRLAVDACQPPRVYYHDWNVGDVVLWDNRRLMHRVTPYDMTQPRRMWHTRIAGSPETDLAINLA